LLVVPIIPSVTKPATVYPKVNSYNESLRDPLATKVAI